MFDIDIQEKSYSAVSLSNMEVCTYMKIGGRDISVGKSSASEAGDPGLNPGGGLTQVTQCFNERGRDYQL